MNNTIINFRKALDIRNNASVDTEEFRNIVIFLTEYIKRSRRSETEKMRIYLMAVLGAEYANKVSHDYEAGMNQQLDEYITYLDEGGDVNRHEKAKYNKIESEIIFKLKHDDELEELKNYTRCVLYGDNPGIFKNKKRRDLTHIISIIGEITKAGY